jgi:hypothetical protein
MRAQVCGATGYAVQAARVSTALAAGEHRVYIERGLQGEHADAVSGEGSSLQLLWQGPGVPPRPAPIAVLP